MLCKYIGTDPLLVGKQFELAGGDAWREPRFTLLRDQNPDGRVVGLTETGEKHLLKIGQLELVPVYKGY